MRVTLAEKIALSLTGEQQRISMRSADREKVEQEKDEIDMPTWCRFIVIRGRQMGKLYLTMSAEGD